MTDSTCDLYDSLGMRARVLPPLFHDFGGRPRFSGVIVTVRCFEDNSRVKEILATAGHGKVLVVDGGGSQRCALMGDLIAQSAVENGWEGVVIYGCVRDRVALRDLALGIKALAAIPRKSERRGEGQIQLPIEIAGIPCHPGDRLVADEDGVLILDPG
jgi:regulator of ribonuclease activity A